MAVTNDSKEVAWIVAGNGRSQSYQGRGWNWYTRSGARTTYYIVAPGGEVVATQIGRTVYQNDRPVVVSEESAWDALYSFIGRYTAGLLREAEFV